MYEVDRSSHSARELRFWVRCRDCTNVRAMICAYCNHRVWVRCERSAGGCEGCAGRYKRRIYRLGVEGAQKCAQLPGDRLFMLTLTAPGEGTDLEAWNAALPQAWSHWVEYARRGLPHCRIEFIKTFEYQKRGALHVHAVVRVVGAVSEKQIRRAFVEARRAWDFGDQWKLDTADEKAAGYICKYIVKHAEEMPKGCGRRVWSSSRGWGTMRALRQRQRTWAEAQTGAAPQGGARLSAALGDAAGIALDPSTDIYTPVHDPP